MRRRGFAFVLSGRTRLSWSELRQSCGASCHREHWSNSSLCHSILVSIISAGVDVSFHGHRTFDVSPGGCSYILPVLLVCCWLDWYMLYCSTCCIYRSSLLSTHCSLCTFFRVSTYQSTDSNLSRLVRVLSAIMLAWYWHTHWLFEELECMCQASLAAHTTWSGSGGG